MAECCAGRIMSHWIVYAFQIWQWQPSKCDHRSKAFVSYRAHSSPQHHTHRSVAYCSQHFCKCYLLLSLPVLCKFIVSDIFSRLTIYSAEYLMNGGPDRRTKPSICVCDSVVYAMHVRGGHRIGIRYASMCAHVFSFFFPSCRLNDKCLSNYSIIV